MGLAFDRKVVENLRYTVARASRTSTERTNLTAFSLVKIEEDIFFGILALIDTSTATASLDVTNTSVKGIIDICASEDVFDTHSPIIPYGYGKTLRTCRISERYVHGKCSKHSTLLKRR